MKCFGPPISSMTAKLSETGSAVVEELRLVGRAGDAPSALAPLSETTMISVLSNSPTLRRKSSNRPMW